MCLAAPKLPGVAQAVQWHKLSSNETSLFGPSPKAVAAYEGGRTQARRLSGGERTDLA